MKRLFCNILIFLTTLQAFCVKAQTDTDSLDSDAQSLQEIVVRTPTGLRKLKRVATNTELISAKELTRAACCNLGESFTTNPSVDVSYSDAATGARQIRLLGLSGTYVQMLTENIPNFRGASGPYGLGYIAGPWMQSIQVSKGASSVKNGYESISGQINVEMKKPQADPSLSLNAYVDHMGKAEINADGNLHFGDKWSSGLLLHGENTFAAHDENGDGFMDTPKLKQFAAMNRWAYLSTNYVFQAGIRFIAEGRESGQTNHHSDSKNGSPLYKINIDTRRAEIFTKNAYIFDKDNEGNVALILSGVYHDQDASYGNKAYDVSQREAYASLMFERKWDEELHALSAGVSFNYDYYGQRYRLNNDLNANKISDNTSEAVGGAYIQYTYNLNSKLIAMAGARYDYSSAYGSMLTPRLHLRYNPISELTINASSGRGYRSAHPLAELNYLLASSRKLEIEDKALQEAAWNYGAGISWTPGFTGEKLTLSAEYYYTDFQRQLCINFDRDPHAVYIYSLHGHSYSHTFQAEVAVTPIEELTITAAYRLTDVKSDYGNGLDEKPLMSKSKWLVTASYAPNMGIWQFDASMSINGSGRMPTPYLTTSGVPWASRFKPYCMLNLQATRNFRNWAIYIGGENITGYRQKNPIIGAANPWGPDFDATMIYGPLHGAVVYAGFRFNITKYI
ncbi:MAG: TonB-dependent receptor [Muribaculaceae bacterium]|nr:TonB-dependent receptor [Muribaculaceae bacterium]